jgi:hypothetical protein
MAISSDLLELVPIGEENAARTIALEAAEHVVVCKHQTQIAADG